MQIHQEKSSSKKTASQRAEERKLIYAQQEAESQAFRDQKRAEREANKQEPTLRNIPDELQQVVIQYLIDNTAVYYDLENDTVTVDIGAESEITLTLPLNPDSAVAPTEEEVLGESTENTSIAIAPPVDATPDAGNDAPFATETDSSSTPVQREGEGIGASEDAAPGVILTPTELVDEDPEEDDDDSEGNSDSEDDKSPELVG